MAVYNVNGIRIDGQSTGGSSRLNNLANTMLLIAHRGSSFYPENTMAAAEGAIETKGYKAIEFDWRFTSDNVPVALHDTTINSTARNDDGSTIGTTIYIANITYAQALQYDFGIRMGSQYAGQRIPTLEEVLLYCKRKGAMLEMDLGGRVTTAAQYKIIYDTVQNCGMKDSVIITIAAAEAPNYQALGTDLILCISGRTDTSKIDDIDPFVAPLKVCSVPLASVTQNLCDYAHNKGYLVKAWTPNSQVNIDTCVNAHVDWMITDNFLPSNL